MGQPNTSGILKNCRELQSPNRFMRSMSDCPCPMDIKCDKAQSDHMKLTSSLICRWIFNCFEDAADIIKRMCGCFHGLWWGCPTFFACGIGEWSTKASCKCNPDSFVNNLWELNPLQLIMTSDSFHHWSIVFHCRAHGTFDTAGRATTYTLWTQLKQQGEVPCHQPW